MPSGRSDPAAVSLSSLDAATAWRRLAESLAAAAGSSRHPLHLLSVATVDADGAAEARTVVLRGFDEANREVRFHTDLRSGKAAAIRRDARVGLHWYDPETKLQVRIPATASLHHADDVARRGWEHSQPMSRACYTTSHAPGETVSSFPPAPAAPAVGDDSGLANFCVVRCRFDSVELLALHATGHERVRIDVASNPVTWKILAP
jgi:pyridoxamine 5'-phosphate oxidase